MAELQFGENDYKYVIQEFSKTMIGARYTYREILSAERVPFKFQTIVDRLIVPYADMDMMLGDHLLNMTADDKNKRIFENLKAKLRISIPQADGSYTTKDMPLGALIAIDPDTKMDRIEDNSVLNSIVSHESQIVNVKNQNLFSIKFVSMLFMGTNSPVKITDVKSGLIRRLIDVNPTGNTFDYDRYMELIGQIDFELGKIANHCLNVYRELGINYYGNIIFCG